MVAFINKNDHYSASSNLHFDFKQSEVMLKMFRSAQREIIYSL